MENETGAQAPGPQTSPLHSLIPLADFKAILGIDDREDNLSRYCLTTATYAIGHYCKRRLFLKRHFEHLAFRGDPLLPLGEYPVREMLRVEADGELLEPGLYRVIPALEGDTGEGPEDSVYSLSLSPALKQGQRFSVIKAVYRAGYSPKEAGDAFGVPPDLASACLELAAWNLTRLKGRRIGITGNIRGSGKEGEHLETSMPENVRFLLEPYRRRTI